MCAYNQLDILCKIYTFLQIINTVLPTFTILAIRLMNFKVNSCPCVQYQIPYNIHSTNL